LDLRRALHELLAGSNPNLVRAISDRKSPNLLAASKRAADLTRQVGERAEISMPAGHRDHGTGRVNARTFDDTLVYCTLQIEDRPPDVTDRSEPPHKRVFRLIRSEEIHITYTAH